MQKYLSSDFSHYSIMTILFRKYPLAIVLSVFFLTTDLIFQVNPANDNNIFLPMCDKPLATRYSAVKSFTWSRNFTHTYSLVPWDFGDKYELTPPTLVMLEDTYAYPMLINYLGRSISPFSSAQYWLKFCQFDKDLRGTVESMYFFSKEDFSVDDYDWSNFNGDHAKPLYQIALTTTQSEVIWSRKYGNLLDTTGRLHPPFTLALDGANNGFVFHKDIYGDTDSLIIYSFNYKPQRNRNFEFAIHQLQADLVAKNEAVYFFIQMTESPSEVKFVPRHSSQVNHRAALFASSLPRGFVYEGILHLFDLSLGCLYRLPLEQIGNLKSKHETGQPFTVTRSNSAVEQFLICKGKEPANVSSEEVTKRCGRTTKTNHPPVPPKPVPDPIIPKPVSTRPKPGPNPPVPPKPVTSAHNPNMPSSIIEENHLSTVPVKPKDEYFPWFWITIGVLVFFLATIFLGLVYRFSRQSSRRMAARKSKSGNVKSKKKKKKKTGGSGLKSKSSSGSPKSTSSKLNRSKSPGRSKLASSISKTGTLPSTSSLQQPSSGISPVSAKIKKSPKMDDSLVWTSVLGLNSGQTPPTVSKTPQSSSSQNVPNKPLNVPPPPPSTAAVGQEQETLLTTILGAPPITSPTSSRSRSQRSTSQVRSTMDPLDGFLSVAGSSRVATSSSTASNSIIGFTDEEDRAASAIHFEVATNNMSTATYQEGGQSKRGISRRSPMNRAQKERGKYG